MYFIQDVVTKEIKIGQSKNPEQRLKDIASSEKRKVIILRYVPAPSLEKMLHSYFSADRIQGEWFYPSDKLIELIKTPNISAVVMYPELIEEAAKSLKIQTAQYIKDSIESYLRPYPKTDYFNYPISSTERYNRYYWWGIKLVRLIVKIDSTISGLWPF